MKTGKVYFEMPGAVKGLAASWLRFLFNKCWTNVHEDWRKGIIIKAKNERGISLLNIVGKTHVRVLIESVKA